MTSLFDRPRLLTLALVFAACAAAFVFWRDDAPIPAAVALGVAAVVEMIFWIRLGRRGR